MPIILSLVAQLPSLRVLVEHCDGTYANCTPAILSQTAKVVLGKVNPRTEPRMSYTHENHMLHTLAAEELIFLCVTDLSCKRQVAFAFLEDLSRRFGTVFPHGSRFPEPWKVSVEMNPVIEALMVATNSQSTGSAKAARAKNAIEEVKGQMMDNIEKVIDRGENIESLMDKSEGLAERSLSFKQSSQRLKNTIWWQNCKTNIMYASFCLIGIVVILLTACGLKLEKCRK